MTEKSQQITFTKGITNQPSDAICSDGELSNCVGLTAEYGELKPIQKPVDTGLNLNAKLWYVHGDRYICLNPITVHGVTTYQIVWKSPTSAGIVDTSYRGGDITSIGNTLIVASSDEMHYYLWKGDGYQDLGTKIPEPEVEFLFGANTSQCFWKETDDGMGHDARTVPPEKQTFWNDVVTGIFYEGVNYLHRRKLFMQPFVAIVAVELYDGSYTLHSNPFIMTPWLEPDILALMNYDAGEGSWDGDTQYIYLFGSSLFYNLKTDYSKWSDIVRGVSLFISREVNMFKTDAVWELVNDGGWYYPAGSGSRQNDSPVGGYMFDNNSIRTWKSVARTYRSTILNYNNCFKIFAHRESSEIQKDLESESVFFKLCDLKSNGLNWDNVGNLFSDTTLDNIEAQQQLPNADYHTHDNTTGSQTYAYNGRLHLTGIKRTLFDGFTKFSYWNTSSQYSYTIDVSITVNTGETKTVRQTVTNTSEAIGQTYFYYPDPRAKSVTIYASNGTYVTRTLREHPGLNGAYWYSIPVPVFVPGSDTRTNPIYAPNPSGSSGYPGYAPNPITEEIVDTIAVSEVDNPFLFLAKGYVKVNAPVVGMAAVTMALSEYQHGHQPLVVFTEKGIWSLSLNAEGYYTSVQAVSREVCNNASSITQVDNGIYFVSQKGLMYLNTAGVKCVSDQMRGTDFDTFIDNCMIAYDYRDSLLHIYHRDSEVYEYTYVYNMKTGTFSQLLDRFDNVVNNYPDTLVQDESNNTYSFLQKPDEQSDNTSYGAYIKTRPMKLENALAMKTILQARHIHTIKTSQTTTIKFKVYASNNLDRAQNTWVQLTSLRGRPWKYYKFVYEFTGLKATDRFAGTMLITQERRTDKLR